VSIAKELHTLLKKVWNAREPGDHMHLTADQIPSEMDWKRLCPAILVMLI